MSPLMRRSGCCSRTWSSLSVPIFPEMWGKVTEKVPPKPQHCSDWPKGMRVTFSIEESRVRVDSPEQEPREWQERWKAILMGSGNLPGQVVMPRPWTMKSMISQVRLARESIEGSGHSSNCSGLPWKHMAAQEPLGTMTGRSPANTFAVCIATLREAFQSPELNAGWPQQVWFSGKTTSTPRYSNTSTVARATSS